MTEPRSISFNSDRWLTDSRVYNLIWLGRWLERAENIARVVNTAARTAVVNGNDHRTFQESLSAAAAAWGIYIEDPHQSLSMLLKEHSASSIYRSMSTARSNATHVGTVELLRAISAVLSDLEEETARANSPEEAQALTGRVLEGLDLVYKIVDESWFHQEPLSEEEVYLRFVQQ